MVVFSNHRLGPAAELLVSSAAAAELLCEVATAARRDAQARWEHELVTWLERCAAAKLAGIDVSDLAWTPSHFERQRGFVIEAIRRAEAGSSHRRALARWGEMIEAHPREFVQVGRRWQWPAIIASA
jgi:hypothetical protein